MDILPHTDTTSIIRVPTLQEEPKGASPLRNCTKVIMNPATKCFNPPAPPHGQTRLLKRKTTSPKWCHMAKAHVTKPRFNTQPNSSFDFHRKCNLNQPVWKFFYCCHFFFLTFGYAGSSLLCTGFSLVVVSRGYSSLWFMGFSLEWLLLLQSTDFRCRRQ